MISNHKVKGKPMIATRTAAIALTIMMIAGCASNTVPSNMAMVQMSNESLQKEISRGGSPERIEGGAWKVESYGNMVTSSVVSKDGRATLIIKGPEILKHNAVQVSSIITETGPVCYAAEVGIPMSGTVQFDDKEYRVARGLMPTRGGMFSFTIFAPNGSFDDSDRLRMRLSDDCGAVFEFEFDITGESHVRAQRVRQMTRLLAARREISNCRLGEYC